jgi:hypothetical protein
MPNKGAGLLPSSSRQIYFRRRSRNASINPCTFSVVKTMSSRGRCTVISISSHRPPFSTAACQRRDGLIRISGGIIGQRPGRTDEDGLSPVERRKQKNLVAAATMTLPSNCSEDKGSASAASDWFPRGLIPLGGPSNVGMFPEKEGNGTSYLKIAINAFGHARW